MTVAQRGMRGLEHKDRRRDDRDLTTSPSGSLGGSWTSGGSRPGPGLFVLDQPTIAAAAYRSVQARPGPLYSSTATTSVTSKCADGGPAVPFSERRSRRSRADGEVGLTKQNLRAQRLDGLGGYDTYGQAESAGVTAGRTCSDGLAGRTAAYEHR